HQPIRFQGQQLDHETGLHYNRFRYYDPMVGQYVTQDPIGLRGGTNKLVYPINPTIWVDPLGLEKEGGGIWGLGQSIFKWAERKEKAEDAIDVGKLALENKKLEKELNKKEEELMMCLMKTPTCPTHEMSKIEDRTSEIKKKIIKNTAKITKVLMETPGTSAGGPIYSPK
ncbi:MAG: RHS repeat-associated core domain-containing protein, partial [Acidovorax sp.]|uniref:RHS repeat-associated core domain-containing protein n=1 Tax=Acidovorax sp. TaxID=1872122 RepID=UPI00391961AD